MRYVEVDGSPRFALRCTLPKGHSAENDGVLVEYSFDGNPKLVGGLPWEKYRYRDYPLLADRQELYKNGHRMIAFWKFSPLTVGMHT